MQDNYIRMTDNFPSAPPHRLLLVAYISQFILYGLIIAYCIISPSLFSTIALLFMLISFAFNIGTPYYILKRNQSKHSVRVFAYPVERILWLVYLGVFVAGFIFKVVVYATGSAQGYQPNKQQFYQIQSALNVFLPLIMLPFIICSAFIRTKSRQLTYFNRTINKLITIPIFIALGILILLIQIFSISVAGFLFFICMMILFFQRKLDFNSYLSWLLVLLIQVLCLGFICTNFLATTTLISSYQTSNIFRFYGIDALNNFTQFKTSQGYIICLILLFIVCCLMQKIFSYSAICQIAHKVYGDGEIKQSQIFAAQGIQIEGEGDRDRMTQRQSIFKQGQIRSYRKDSRYSLQQFQLPSVERNLSGVQPGLGGSIGVGRNRTQIYGGALGQPLINPIQRQRQQQIQNRQSRKSISFNPPSQKKPLSKFFLQKFLIAINNIVQFIYSTQFTLRVTQVLSIVVIQRYNNIYSFVAVIWLAVVASTSRTRIIYLITSLILLPVQIGNFIIMYAYNAPQSPIAYLQNLNNYGFQIMQLFWLDIIIFNVYLFYMMTFILAAGRDQRQHIHQRQYAPKIPHPNFWIILLAFFFRYSYLLTLVAMFFLGFSTVNLLNFVYISLFLVFFSFGQNVLIQTKIRNGKQIIKLTTFSRKYWFIIVYYTLVCIILKYCYFLFFPNDLVIPLQPTGINMQYNWSFNFSLSSTCLSNTTPFFIIFILSQAQIMIYRSSIYLNYSFSLISQITQIKKPNKNNLRVVLNSAVQIILQFYYQSLYYVSGLIILACSYRWNLLSLSIIIITCIGIMKQFNRFILAFIVFVNLTYILLNYFVLFIKYQSIQNFLGETVINIIKQISLFIGLDLTQQYSLSGVFALNIVIFYFAVESYALCKIIAQDRFNQDGDLADSMSVHASIQQQQQQGQGQQGQGQIKIQQDTLSKYQPTILQSQYGDTQFGKNFNKNVIISTKKLYATVLYKKYTWFNKLCTILNIFYTDAITIFVLVCCLQFRLSISMFYFLFIYMLYYLVLFDKIGQLMQTQQYYERIQRQLQFFKRKQIIICQRQSPRSMITGQQSSQSVIAFIDATKQKSINMKFHWRNLLWYFSAFVSVLCLILTYTSQFIISQFYQQYINNQYTLTLQSILFVLGVSTTRQNTLYRQIYFYYFMIAIGIVEKLLIRYSYMKRQQEKIQSKPVNLNKRQYSQLEDPANFIDESIDVVQAVEMYGRVEDYMLDRQVGGGGGEGRGGVQEIQSKSKPNNKPKSQPKSQPKPQQQPQLQSDFAKQSNLLIYFDYKGTLIKNNILYGTLMMLLRLYLLMMLINLYQKSNIFAFAYLFSVLFFWFQPLNFKMVRHINKIAITILLLQYLMLLLDICTQTTPLSKPNYQNLSILQMFISSQTWINYLVVDFGKTTTGSSYLVSFLISSIIVFLTQMYFVLFFAISRLSVQMTRKVYDRYQYIGQNLQRMPQKDTIYLNYQNYKNWTYRFMTLSYQLLINNSYIVVSYLILILLANITNYIAFGLVFFACVYIYIGIFTGFSQDKNIYTYTKIFFWIVQIILFLVLVVITIAQIPIFEQSSQTVTYIVGLSNIQQIFLLFLIQIWLDLSTSQQFKQATQQYDNKVKNRQNVMIKCIAYQQNKDLIKRMLKRYKQVMWFQVNLKDALDIIDQWHKAMYKKKVPQFENLKISKDSLQIQALKHDIKKQQQRRPQQDEQILQKFKKFMINKTSVALQNRYYQIMRYIVFNNHRLIDIQNCSIDIWDYVLENYQKLNNQIKQSQTQLNGLIKIIQNQQVGDRMDRLEIIKKEEYSQPAGNLNQVVMGIIKAPAKIFIDIKLQNDQFSKIFIFFILSNFSYLLSFFTWAYYMINPCLLSTPFIVYFFSYQLISDHKLTSLMLIYIFSIILLAVWVQVRGITHQDWVKYLFYKNDDGNYVFAIGYLFFIFILIFINEEIKKYQGNKFKHPHQAQNRIQGAFRILINTDPNSSMYLWNLKVQDDYQQKQCNPMQYFSQKIQYKPQDLTNCPMPSFFESFNQGKTGIDLYPLIATIQIFLTIYLIFFYPFMVQSQNTSLTQSFKYFQFSGNMVIAVFTHVVSIVIQRKITLIRPQNQYKSLIKYIYTMLILGLLLIFIYFIAPENKNIKGVYRPRGFLIAFAFFYFFYFFLSALQIKLGYKKYKSLNSTMTRRRQLNNLIMIVFTAVPFLYELKLMMDYSFCDTSLKIFDWFRLFSIYYSAFKAKMQYYSSTGVILGNPQPWILKSIGWFGFIGILIIIFGPMYLFSGLNPIAQPNLVTGGALQLGIQIQNGNYFGLYSTSHFSQPPLTYTAQQFYSQNFAQVPQLQFLTSSDIPQQFQLVQFQPYSDTNWAISQPNFLTLTTLMQQTIIQLNNNQTPTHNFSIVVKYALDRRVTQTLSSDTNFAYPFNNTYLNSTQLTSLYETFMNCNSYTYLPQFYISLIRLFTIGNTYKPRPIQYVNSSGIDPYFQGVYLTLLCDGVNSTKQTNNVYWSLVSTNTTSPQPDKPTDNGIFLYVLCDKYQNLIGGLGFTALYTSVILVVAGFIRSAFQANLPQIPYFQNPKPDNIIQISQAIGTLRDRKQFRQEYLMYYQLIDIIRSPDLMKYLSGSYPMLIEEADQKRRKKQQDKELESRRDKIQ